MRSRLALGTALLTILLTASTASGSGAAQARTQAGGPSSATAQYGHKVTICLNGHTIEVDSSSVDAFIAQGATLGRCKSGVEAAKVVKTRETTKSPHATPKVVAHVAPQSTG